MRLYRLLSIIMLLINRDRLTAANLAKHFEVSTRTIYRDMETINEAGIPIVSYQGIDGGFSIMDNFKIDKNILTPEEISSIIIALNGLNSTLDDNKLQNITEKMRSLFQNNDQRDNIPEEFIIDLDPWNTNQRTKDKLNLLKKAIKNEKIVQIYYINLKGEALYREVEPLSLVLKGTTWYLYAFCRLRNGYRIFRISRMENLKIIDKIFTRKEKTFTEFEQENNWGKNIKPVNLVLKFHSRIRLRVQDYFGKEQITINKDGSITVKLTYPEDEWVYGFLLSFGANVEVISPKHIREILKNTALKVFNIYKT